MNEKPVYLEPLKNISQLEHSRHRSVYGFMLNLMGGLIAYCLKEDKPPLNLSAKGVAALQGVGITISLSRSQVK